MQFGKHCSDGSVNRLELIQTLYALQSVVLMGSCWLKKITELLF